MHVFSAVREWNVTLVRSLPQDAFTRPVTHPERGTMTLLTIVETMAGHDLNHLGQLEAIGKRADRLWRAARLRFSGVDSAHRAAASPAHTMECGR